MSRIRLWVGLTVSDEFEQYILKNRKDWIKLKTVQEKELGRLYIQFAESIKKDAERIIDKTTWSYTQKKKEISALLKEADRLTNGFKRTLNGVLIDSANLGQEVNGVMLEKYSQRLSGAGFDVDLKRVLTGVTDDTVKVIYSRIWEDGLKLSDRIWLLEKRTKREIERIVLEEIVSGRPASDRVLEARLNKLLNPDRRVITTKLHGRRVQFDAARLLRTERTIAFREADRMASLKNPGLIGIQWHTSGDACTTCSDLASSDSGLGPGVYKPENLPTNPHPHCECYTTDKAISSQQFVNNWIGYMKNPASQPQLGSWFKEVYRKVA